MKKILYFATGNRGKFYEAQQVVSKTGWELEMAPWKCLEIQADTLQEAKGPGLEALAKMNRVPILTDDSGLFIKSLGGFPGVYSAYAFKTLGNKGILSLLKGVRDREAHFECCAGIAFPGKEPVFFSGVSKGRISQSIRGKGGFGFDPIFVPRGFTRTFALIDTDEKNRISHRGKAMKKVVDYLRKI